VRTLRRVALVGALLALVAIGLKPHWTASGPAGTVVLVTPGADAPAVRRLADSLGGAPVVNQADSVRRLAPVRRVFVAGWGLDPEDWRELDSIPVAFRASAPPRGLASISWPAAIPLGGDLVVEGRVAAPPTGSVITLLDLGGAADSAALNGAGAFQLVSHPRALGPMLGVLRVSIGDQRVAEETIAVTVVPPRTDRLLILEAAPRFETGALRDWVAGHGGAVAVRSTVSRDRYHTEFVNRGHITLDALTSRLLTQFDAVVLDGRTLAGLTTLERAALRQAVTETGLGLLIEADTALYDGSAHFSDRDFFFGFAFRAAGGLDERAVRPTWPGAQALATTALAAEPYTLMDRFGAEPVVEDGVGGVLAQVTPRGAGWIGVSLVRESDRWIRSGDRVAFGALWSRLVGAITAGRAGREDWEVRSPGPWLVDQPVALAVDAPGEHPVGIVITPSGASDSVFLARDPVVSSRWTGLFWPRETGWHRVGSASGPGFYAQAAGVWDSRRSEELLEASARYLAASGAPPPGPGTLRPVSHPIPAGWLFTLFLVCASLLWSYRTATRSVT
jgi:hypothetical protein